MRATSKIGSIQRLRAVSVLAVIAFHYGLGVSSGYVGVDVFFTISGFVITTSLIGRHNHGQPGLIRDFYLRRIKRLFPAFFAVTIMTMLVIIFFYSPNMGFQQNALKSAIGAATGLANFVLPRITPNYFSQDSSQLPFLHTWSLSVEEQFYLVFPMLFVLISRKKVKPKVRNFILISIVVVSFAAVLNPLASNSFLLSITPTFYSPIARAWEFILGALIAFNIDWLRAKLSRVPGRVIGLIIILIFIFLVPTSQNSIWMNCVPVLGGSLYLVKSKPDGVSDNFWVNWIRKFFGYIGDISYSLYLWHWPVWVTLKYMYPNAKGMVTFVALGLTFLLSSLTYGFIEKKFTKTALVKMSKIAVYFALGLVVETALLGATYVGTSTGWGKDWALNSHLAMRAHCDLGVLGDPKCSWGNANSTKKLILVGDSMAWAIGDAVIPAAEYDGYSVSADIFNGCSVTSVEVKSGSTCDIWRSTLLAKLLIMKPQMVVMANSDGYSPQELMGYGNFAKALLKIGTRVLFVTSPAGGDQYSERRALFFHPGDKTRTSKIPTPFNPDLHGFNLPSLDPHFEIFNVNQHLCTRSCPISIDGHELYNYGAHLSLYGDRLLIDAMRTEISILSR